MMEGIRTWLMGVVLTAFAAGLARQLSAGQREQRLISLAGGLLVLSAFLKPVAELPWEDASVAAGTFSRSAAESVEGLRREQTDALAGIIEERTAAYICDKSRELGCEREVTVVTQPGESGLPLPWSVTLEGPFSQKLSDWIGLEAGIPAERQNWLEGRNGEG